jgi:outer membrane immunogenic protein
LGNPVALMLSPGQTNDLICAEPLLADSDPAALLGDKGIRRRRLHRLARQAANHSGDSFASPSCNTITMRFCALLRAQSRRALLQQTQAFPRGGIAFAGVPFPFIDFGSQNGSSVVGGGQIGCDYQFASNWVVGIQGQGDFGTINSSNAVAAFPGIIAQFQVKNIETLTERVGYTITPAILAYVKGGAASANASGAAIIPGGLVGESANFTMTGYTVGGSLEWMFAPGWSVFGEYNYMDFGTKNVNFASTGLGGGLFGPAGTLADTTVIKLTTQTAIVGVNYKFG